MIALLNRCVRYEYKENSEEWICVKCKNGYEPINPTICIKKDCKI